MSAPIAVITGVVLAAVLVAAVSVRRDEAQPSKPAAIAFEARLEQDIPVLPKADRLPLPVMQVFVGGSSDASTSDVSNPRASEPYSGGNATANVGQRDRKVTDDARGVGSDEHSSIAADMTSRERPAHFDPVCGPHGRTWYTKDNGWRYWRCQR